jgi:hypothetical protein
MCLTEVIPVGEVTELKKGKVLKSLTLPQLIAKDLEQIAKVTRCKQADLVTVGLEELKKLNEDELTELLIQYQIY